MSVLITGFEPFHEHQLNPSGELLKELPRVCSDKSKAIDTLLLPVSYSRSCEVLVAKLWDAQPEHLIMMGLAGSRSKIAFEKVALNYADSNDPDADGVLLTDQLLIDGSPNGIINPMPLTTWVSELGTDTFEMSLSAGSFVCNALYYTTLLHAPPFLKSQLFIHLPPFHSIPLQMQLASMRKLLDTYYLAS